MSIGTEMVTRVLVADVLVGGIGFPVGFRGAINFVSYVLYDVFVRAWTLESEDEQRRIP